MASKEQVVKHSEIIEVLSNLWLVTGENRITLDGFVQQHSSNMIIIKQDGKLSLINTVKLSEAGLIKLDELGEVESIYRIGSFHGRNDAFYHQRYNNASFYTLDGLKDDHGGQPTHQLKSGDSIPINNSQLIFFESTKLPEAVIYLSEHGGVLITCDSIKNWIKPDEYFNEETTELFKKQGFFKPAMIDKVWINATQVSSEDLVKLQKLAINHLLSAHGEALLNVAGPQIDTSIEEAVSIVQNRII